MEEIIGIIVSAAAVFLLIKLISTPIRWFWKVACHVLCGFACLFLLNLCAGFTGVVFPLNLTTAAFSGFLGAPGVLLLLAAQYFFL